MSRSFGQRPRTSARMREVVGLPEAAGQAEQAHAALVERVFQFDRLVGGIDVDQDRADAGRRVLEDDPLEAVGRPHADAVAGAEPRGPAGRGPRGRPAPTSSRYVAR